MTRILEARLTELGAVFDAPDPPAAPEAPAAPRANPTPPTSTPTAGPDELARGPAPRDPGLPLRSAGPSRRGSESGMRLTAAAALIALRRRTNRQSTAAKRS